MLPTRKAVKQMLWEALAKRGYEVREKELSLPEMSEDDRRLLQSVRPYTMTTPERLWATVIALRHVVRNRIDGDFVECGVWRGGQAMTAAEILKREGQQRRIWLFDTFAGMTAPTDEDARLDGRSVQAEYEASLQGEVSTWCYASLEDVRANMGRTGYPKDLVTYVKGPVEETLQVEANLPQSIAVLRLDTDFYESTRKELDVLYPRLARGGVMMVDDYGYWRGSRQAVDEYFASMGVFPLLQPIDREARLFVKP